MIAIIMPCALNATQCATLSMPYAPPETINKPTSQQ